MKKKTLMHCEASSELVLNRRLMRELMSEYIGVPGSHLFLTVRYEDEDGVEQVLTSPESHIKFFKLEIGEWK